MTRDPAGRHAGPNAAHSYLSADADAASSVHESEKSIRAVSASWPALFFCPVQRQLTSLSPSPRRLGIRAYLKNDVLLAVGRR